MAIDISQIQIISQSENVINIDDFVKEYREMLESNILLKEGMLLKADGKFDSNLWIVYLPLNQTFTYFKFDELQDLKRFKIISNDEIMLLKCLLAKNLLDEYNASIVYKKYRNILEFIKITENFNKTLQSNDIGDLIETYINEYEDEAHNRAYNIIEYIDFFDSVGLIEEKHEMVLPMIINIYNTTNKKATVRKLPENKDIFAFDSYLKKFYSSKDNSQDIIILKKIYKPILIWWKVTNVIPMRPSELTTLVPRDGVFCEDERYYLKINRTKIKRDKRKIIKGRAYIPLLTKLEITEEIYSLIREYIDETCEDENCISLFSYNMLCNFKEQYMKFDRDAYDDPFFQFTKKKYEKNCFTRRILANLIKSFYSQVIEKRYNHKLNTKLRPGDTRHLAFSSLIFQGISPIEIAMLGGHVSIQTQDHYIGHADYYIDSEIIDFVTQKNVDMSSWNGYLKEKIFKNNWEHSISLLHCKKTEDGIGYCFRRDEEFCETVPCCIYCNKWWCAPTNENYILAKKYIEEEKISPLKELIQNEEAFLAKLIDQAEYIKVDENIMPDKKSQNKIKQISLKVRKYADQELFLRKSLLEIPTK